MKFLEAMLLKIFGKPKDTNVKYLSGKGKKKK